MGDPNQLENAIQNLAINAQDAMPDGGLLTIETANVVLEPSAAQERDMAPGDYIEVSVTDTGDGMPPDAIAHGLIHFLPRNPLAKTPALAAR